MSCFIKGFLNIGDSGPISPATNSSNDTSEIDQLLSKSKENQIRLDYNTTSYHLTIIEKDYSMNPKEIEGYDGMIFVYSCTSKSSFDEMMLFFIKI